MFIVSICFRRPYYRLSGGKCGNSIVAADDSVGVSPRRLTAQRESIGGSFFAKRPWQREFAGMKRVGAVLTIGILGGVFLFSGASLPSPARAAAVQSSDLPDGSGKALVSENCSSCHGLELVTAQRRSPEDWEQVVNRMITNGNVLTEDQHKEVVAYLGTYLAKEPRPGAAPISASGASGVAAAPPAPNSKEK